MKLEGMVEDTRSCFRYVGPQHTTRSRIFRLSFEQHRRHILTFGLTPFALISTLMHTQKRLGVLTRSFAKIRKRDVLMKELRLLCTPLTLNGGNY
jgi:hypothetical protein